MYREIVFSPAINYHEGQVGYNVKHVQKKLHFVRCPKFPIVVFPNCFHSKPKSPQPFLAFNHPLIKHHSSSVQYETDDRLFRQNIKDNHDTHIHRTHTLFSSPHKTRPHTTSYPTPHQQSPFHHHEPHAKCLYSFETQ